MRTAIQCQKLAAALKRRVGAWNFHTAKTFSLRTEQHPNTGTKRQQPDQRDDGGGKSASGICG